MTTKSTNPKVDRYFVKAKNWRAELGQVRKIILSCPLTEELKWGKPCYSFERSNLVILVPLKESCALLFCKGALLKDAAGILIKPGENSQSARWAKFTSVREIAKMKSILKAYLLEAIEAKKAGLQVKYKKTSDYKIPEELQARLDKTPALKAAFGALTPGRQRGYILFFSAAKQSRTRESRVEKCISKILNGKGLND